jgi:N-acetylneuraminate synthase/N,N'-diacetyllegionaminate synthase
MSTFQIGKRQIGPGYPCFIIAEAGVNHGGRVELAKKLIDSAVEAGADAIKFQTFKAENLTTPAAKKAEYQVKNTGSDESQLEMLHNLELPYEAHIELQRYAEAQGILFFSSPFDQGSADLLEQLNVPVYKLGSGEITNLGFLSHVARKGKPMIISTGMSYLAEIEAAIQEIELAGCHDYALLHCVSNYPTEPGEANLMAMATLRRAFAVPIGYSDHTMGIEVPVAAVALGASILEKHITLDRNLPGPDNLCSLEPGELKLLVSSVRNVEAALGDGKKIPNQRELMTARAARKSLVAAQRIPAGAVITNEQLVCKRPGTGLPPALLPFLLGRTARIDIEPDTMIEFGMLV